jgi:anion-transporting  ArsA/GET3 family ATPase
LLDALLDQKRTLIVVGSGGVGKTTTAAALALHGARNGKKVLVLTVDPARRLANALGLQELGNEEVRIDPALFEAAGVSQGDGALYGMMLDTKTTFDALIARHAPSPAARDRILANPFYKQASTALAGSQEYMAMEKLYEVRVDRDYDLIVLDTPPTPNALDFLSAADRLGDFLDSSTVSVLLASVRAAGRFGLSLLRLNSFMLRGLNRFVGADTFAGILDFIDSFQEMFSGFKARARRVSEILRSADVSFVVVSSTDLVPIQEGVYFHDQLLRHRMPFGAFVVNRVRNRIFEPGQVAGLEQHLRRAARDEPALGLYETHQVDTVVERVAHACNDYARLADMDASRIDDLRGRLGQNQARIWTVPLFDEDIHDIAGLARFGEHVVRGG